MNVVGVRGVRDRPGRHADGDGSDCQEKNDHAPKKTRTMVSTRLTAVGDSVIKRPERSRLSDRTSRSHEGKIPNTKNL